MAHDVLVINNIPYRTYLPLFIILNIMKEEVESPHFKPSCQHKNSRIQSDLVKTQGAAIGSFIKVSTGIPNFRPIYTVSQKPSILNYKLPLRKNSKRNIETDVLKEPMQQKILKFGSQLFLKFDVPIDLVSLSPQLNQPAQVLKPFIFPNSQETVFAEIIVDDCYLTKVGETTELREEYSSEAIWVIQIVQKNKVRICNISGAGYLEINTSKRKRNNNNNKFTLCGSPTVSTIFHIELAEPNSNSYTLSQLTARSQTPSKKSFQPTSEKGEVNEELNSSELADEDTIEIQMFPVSNSVANIWYELTFAIEGMKSYPSLSLIKAITDELIYYNVGEMVDNQGLISEHIQTLFVECGLSNLFFQFLAKYIQGESSYTELMRSSRRYQGVSEIETVISKHLRLLCHESQKNSQIFWPLVLLMIDSPYFYLFVPCLRKFIRNNPYFIQNYQSKGLNKIMVNKIVFLFTTRNYEGLKAIYQLLADFCTGDYSIPNKYLVMHTFQGIEYSKTKSTAASGIQSRQSIFPWLQMYGEGMYVFTQTLQTQSADDQQKYTEIQLKTYLNQSVEAEAIFIGQLALMASFCQGYNLNVISKYLPIMKSIVPYCFTSMFPGFEKLTSLNATLDALTIIFDWTPAYQRFQNGYLLGVILSEAQQQELGRFAMGNQMTKSKGNRNTQGQSKMFRSTYEQNNNNSISYDVQSLFKHFEGCMKRLVNDTEDNVVSIRDYVMDQSRLQGSFLLWMKIVRIAIDLKIFGLLKKKEAPYLQYLKKIFQNTNFRRSRSKTPKKDGLQSTISKNSIPRDSLIPENEYQPEANIVLQVLSRLFKFNPQYEFYLRILRITREGGGKSNKEKFMERVFKIKNSSINTYFRESNESDERSDDKNSFIHWAFTTNNQHQNQKLLSKLNQVKEVCFDIQAQMYQKLLEEEMAYAVDTLAYLIRNPSHLSTNKYDLNNGLKKLPYTEENHRLVLLQNWYLASNPKLLDKVTTNLRYVYDQADIYIRSISMVFVVCQKETLDFYQTVSAPMSQLLKLACCVATWFRPALLFATVEYQEKYRIALRAFQSINNYLRKLTFLNHLYLMDCQKILQNLKLLDIVVNFTSWLNSCEKTAKKNERAAQSLNFLQEQVKKLLEFYIFDSEDNRKKVLLLTAFYLTQSQILFPVFIALLTQNKHLFLINELIEEKVYSNIVKMLPHSKQYLEFLLMLDELNFVKALHELGSAIENQSKNSREQNEFEQRIQEVPECAHLVCKLAYRSLQITKCSNNFISWFYDRFLIVYLARQTKTNFHFKSKIIQSSTVQSIDVQSSLMFLLHKIYFDQSLKIQQKDQQRTVAIGQLTIQKEEGRQQVTEFLLNQILATFLDRNPNVLKRYIQYYIFDLLPMLRLSMELLSFEEVKSTLLQKIEQYLQSYQEIIDKENDFPTLDNNSNGKDLRSPNTKRTQSQKMEESEKPMRKPRKALGWDKSSSFIFSIDNFNREKILNTLRKYIDNKHFETEFQPRQIALFHDRGFGSKKFSSPLIKSPTKSERNQIQPKRDPEEEQVSKLGKKAVKKWYKARHSLHECREDLTAQRSKFLTDVQNLEYQFLLQNDEMKEKIINGKDVICKIIRVIGQFHRIQLSKQNEIFLCKFFILWLRKTIEEERKTKPNTKKGRKQDNPQKQVYLIKKYSISDVMSDLLEQIYLKIKNQKSSIICICYILKILHCIFQLSKSTAVASIISETDKIGEMISLLTGQYHLHRELVQQIESNNVMDFEERDEDISTPWSALGLTCQLLRKMITNLSQQELCLSSSEFQILSRCLLRAKLKLGKNIIQKDLIEIDECLNAFENQQGSLFEKISIEIRYYDDYYSTLASLQ